MIVASTTSLAIILAATVYSTKAASVRGAARERELTAPLPGDEITQGSLCKPIPSWAYNQECEENKGYRVVCGDDRVCGFWSACLAEAAGYDIETECANHHDEYENQNEGDCKPVPSWAYANDCKEDYPVVCGEMYCRYLTACNAEAAGYDIESDCFDDELPVPVPDNIPASP